jgi:hypothetical protein
MSDFVFLFRSDEPAYREAMSTPERAQKSLETWLAWIRELEAGGHLLDPGQPLERTGAVVHGKEKLVTDGPYAEAKDMVLGFIVVSAGDLTQAVQLASRCPIVAGGGSVEVRPIMKGQL